jgi:hypothetical protein
MEINGIYLRHATGCTALGSYGDGGGYECFDEDSKFVGAIDCVAGGRFRFGNRVYDTIEEAVEEILELEKIDSRENN